jgi:hypothetical protein
MVGLRRAQSIVLRLGHHAIPRENREDQANRAEKSCCDGSREVIRVRSQEVVELAKCVHAEPEGESSDNGEEDADTPVDQYGSASWRGHGGGAFQSSW